MLLLYNPFHYYYQILSSMLSNYYTQNTFIFFNLTNHFIINIKHIMFLLYSAYRELNSALYHISQLKSNEIYYYYNYDVYYFLKKGMSNLLINSEKKDIIF